MMFENPLFLPNSERDVSGLTDRAYLDVLGLCVSTAIVTWLLYELTLALNPESSTALVALLATLGAMVYLVSWLEELGRQTLIYVGTWRYGGLV